MPLLPASALCSFVACVWGVMTLPRSTLHLPPRGTPLTRPPAPAPQDVPRLGRRGEVKLANPGWMRHVLFPDGMAVYATPDNVARHALVRGLPSSHLAS